MTLAIGIVKPLTYCKKCANIPYMESKLRTLLKSITDKIDDAMNGIVWKDHPCVIEDLRDARDFVDISISMLGDPDDPEELDFDV